MGRLVVVTGTGTGIGKTHLSEALLLAWGRSYARVCGLKPVESGVPGEGPTDSERLARAGTFHVQHPGYALREPVSPHLAARQEGVVIDPHRVVSSVSAVRESADITLVELPGGLFSPLGDGVLNSDLAALLRPTATVLVAPDRLGVLHDVVATTRAATGLSLALRAVAIVAPERADASTGTNAPELALFCKLSVHDIPGRVEPAALAEGADVRRLATDLTR